MTRRELECSNVQAAIVWSGARPRRKDVFLFRHTRMGQPLSIEKRQRVEAVIAAGRRRVEVEITVSGIDESRAGSLDRCDKGIRNRR